MADEKEQFLRRLRAQGLRAVSVSPQALRELYDRATAEGWGEERTRKELHALLLSTLDGVADETNKPAA